MTSKDNPAPIPIREDIFPEGDQIKVQHILQAWAHLTQEAFSKIFSSQNEVIQYVNNFKNPKLAKMFLEVGKYYYSAKHFYCSNCFPPKKIDSCPNCKKSLDMPAFIVLIMIISIMERLALGLRKYQDFCEWTNSRKTKLYYRSLCNSGKVNSHEELLNELRQKWLDEYGCTTKITDFFSKFMKREEKEALVKSIIYFVEAPDLPPRATNDIEGKSSEELTKIFDDWVQNFEQDQKLVFGSDEEIINYVLKEKIKNVPHGVPVCFNPKKYWKCYGRSFTGKGFGYCCQTYECPLSQDEDLLDRCLIQTVKTIYDWRSKFVHQASILPIRESITLSDYYDEKLIMVELTTEGFKPIFEKMVKRYFDQYQKTIS